VFPAGLFVTEQLGEVVDVELSVDDLLNMILIDPGPAFRNLGCGGGVGTGSSHGIDGNRRGPRGWGC
jgi:hypothetical protein